MLNPICACGNIHKYSGSYIDAQTMQDELLLLFFYSLLVKQYCMSKCRCPAVVPNIETAQLQM